jgi:phenylalanyl-tRNA synthetase beta chain
MALRLELLDDAANLTDQRIDAVVSAALQRVQAAFGTRLRG